MNTKLTLTIDDSVIKKAKKYAKNKGRSVSEIIENYLKLLTNEGDNKLPAPSISELRGTFKLDATKDSKQILEEELLKKYQ